MLNECTALDCLACELRRKSSFYRQYWLISGKRLVVSLRKAPQLKL